MSTHINKKDTWHNYITKNRQPFPNANLSRTKRLVLILYSPESRSMLFIWNKNRKLVDKLGRGINCTKKIQTERAASGSDSIAMVYLHFLITAEGVVPIEAPSSASSSHCNLQCSNYCIRFFNLNSKKFKNWRFN